MFDLILGALAAIATILVIRRWAPRREQWFYAVALSVAAWIYVAFAVVGGAGRWTMVEVGGVVIYSTLAYLGWRISPWFLVFGWATHVVWDLALHGSGMSTGTGAETGFVPGWYPVACLGYDLVLATYLASRSRAWTAAR